MPLESSPSPAYGFPVGAENDGAPIPSHSPRGGTPVIPDPPAGMPMVGSPTPQHNNNTANSAASSRTPGTTNVGASVAINIVGRGIAGPSNMVDEGWHAARSSGNALMPTINGNGAPMRKKHILVEHTNGIFVPQSAHEQIRKAEEARKISLMMSQGGQVVGGSGWGEREDAKNFIGQVTQMKKVIAKIVHLFGAFSFGFCAFQFLNTYTYADNKSADVFLPAYSRFYAVQQKIMMVSMMVLVIFHSFPVAFEFGTSKLKSESVAKTLAAKNQRQQGQIQNNANNSGGNNNDASSSAQHGFGSVHNGGGTAAGSTNNNPNSNNGSMGFKSFEGGNPNHYSNAKNNNSDNSEENFGTTFLNLFYGKKTTMSPLRHFFSLQFLCYVVALAATVVITSVEEGRDAEEIRAISNNLLQRIQIAQIVRVAALGIACVASLR